MLRRFIGVLAIVIVSTCLTPGAARADERVADLYRQSYAAEATGNYTGALDAMESIAGRIGRDDYVATLRVGWLFYLAGRYQDAAISYSRAVQMEPQAIEPKVGIMLPLMAQRRWKDAERYGSEILKTAPGESVVQGRMAYIQFMLGNYEKAAAGYRAVLAAYPANVEMRAGLAWSLLKLSRFQEAKAEFDRVLAVAPDHASAKEGRGLIP
jgi:tetratricopeptide (TPR) repeat protein